MASNIFNNPFPPPQSERKEFFYALFTGIFVGGFLAIFKPFGLDESNGWTTIKILGYGFITFFCLLIIYFVIPKLFPQFFKEANYTVGKEIIGTAITILIIGTGNMLYLNVWENLGISYYFQMIWNTFLIGIFPFTFIILIRYTFLLRSHIQDSADINNAAVNNQPKVIPSTPTLQQVNRVKINTDNESLALELEDLLFIESVGNYANIVQKSDGKITRNLHRTTLKSIEADNDLEGFMRCHRSYIVNLQQVTEVNGNAQGLRLSLKECPEVVPVSRKYVPVVKSYFG